MSKDLHEYASIPLKQQSNRVWRTYTGGALIDRWKKEAAEQDGSFPEEWIMSTIAARGKGRPENEGLSIVHTPEGDLPLKELIAADPSLFLGKEHVKTYDSAGVLIKMLDSCERLTIQVHPDKKYAREILGSEFGKTESWYILGGREIDGEKSAVYMGFKKGVTKDIWKDLFQRQDIAGMLNCLHRFEVQPGDAFMVYGGVPHAIGAGCFLLEVQEPTDYTMRVEKTTPGGLTISDELIHQGVGEEKMLDCFHYEGCTFEEAEKNWKITPQVIDSSPDHQLKSIFNETHTDCFAVNELTLHGEYSIKGNRRFFVAVIYSGEGTLYCNEKITAFSQGDEIFFSAAIDEITFTAKKTARVLFCYPPLI